MGFLEDIRQEVKDLPPEEQKEILAMAQEIDDYEDRLPEREE